MDENNVVPEVPETITESEAAEAEAGAVTRDEAVAAGVDVDAVEAGATHVEVVPDSETPAEEVPAEPVADVPVLKFSGQVVVTDGTRTVEGREMHHLTLADGSQVDASDEDYDAAVEASK